MGRKGREDQSSRERPVPVSEGRMESEGDSKRICVLQKGDQAGPLIIRGQENGSITDYFPLLPDLQEHNGDKQLGSHKCLPNVLDYSPLCWLGL